MRYDEPFVAGLAIGIAIIALAIAVGPWSAPYRLRTIQSIDHKFGKVAARAAWILVAIAMFVTGLAIVSGTRPSYAIPAEGVSSDQ